MAQLNVGFILARRFTLCALGNFVDVLRLAADEGDRSRPILCAWRVLSPTMEPIASSSGIVVQPDERLGDPDPLRLPRRRRRAGRRDREPASRHRALPRARGRGRRAAGRRLHRHLRAAPGRADAGLSRLRQLVPPRGLPRAVRRAEAGLATRSSSSTATGSPARAGVSSAHLAAFIVERHLGTARAAKSLHIMIIDEAMAAEEPQPGMPLALVTDDALVRRALLVMQQSIDAPLSIGRVVAQLGREPAQARAALPRCAWA